MNGRVVFGILLAIVLIVGAVGLGVYTYNVGVAQGLAQNASGVAPAAGGVPYPFYRPFFFHPFGWGFGFLGCLFPLLFFFLIFSLIRMVIWGPRWGWRHHRHWDADGHTVPPMVEEWHRKMHEPKTTDK